MIVIYGHFSLRCMVHVYNNLEFLRAEFLCMTDFPKYRKISQVKGQSSVPHMYSISRREFMHFWLVAGVL